MLPSQCPWKSFAAVGVSIYGPLKESHHMHDFVAYLWKTYIARPYTACLLAPCRSDWLARLQDQSRRPSTEVPWSTEAGRADSRHEQPAKKEQGQPRDQSESPEVHENIVRHYRRLFRAGICDMGFMADVTAEVSRRMAKLLLAERACQRLNRHVLQPLLRLNVLPGISRRRGPLRNVSSHHWP